jgi:hypothetical protein
VEKGFDTTPGVIRRDGVGPDARDPEQWPQDAWPVGRGVEKAVPGVRVLLHVVHDPRTGQSGVQSGGGTTQGSVPAAVAGDHRACSVDSDVQVPGGNP